MTFFYSEKFPLQYDSKKDVSWPSSHSNDFKSVSQPHKGCVDTVYGQIGLTVKGDLKSHELLSKNI